MHHNHRLKSVKHALHLDRWHPRSHHLSLPDLVEEPTAGKAVGALAVGLLAAGALAFGAVAIYRLAIAEARIRKLQIDELEVRNFRITGDLALPEAAVGGRSAGAEDAIATPS